jgi:hypothetical protein
LVISMGFAFWAVGSNFLRGFHTDQIGSATSFRGLFIVGGVARHVSTSLGECF